MSRLDILRGQSADFYGEIMSLSDFWLSVVASIVAAVLVMLAAKITLEKWKKVAIGIGALAIGCTIVSFLIFAGLTVTKEFSAHQERSALQAKIDAYTRGHYPVEYDKGYRLEVTKLGERPLLAFMYPEGVEASPAIHPWSNDTFAFEIEILLNDNGYPGTPAWAYEMRPMTPEQVSHLMQRKLD
ncbi:MULTISPECIES: hypothetical protein [Pseudomonas]|uniref:hypothetical protein n=1 Tax=Pseudomonas TaxID=286 RepID=UPI001944C9DC|nr:MULTISPECIES: hypothetical protein [Pseudomonas]